MSRTALHEHHSAKNHQPDGNLITERACSRCRPREPFMRQENLAALGVNNLVVVENRGRPADHHPRAGSDVGKSRKYLTRRNCVIWCEDNSRRQSSSAQEKRGLANNFLTAEDRRLTTACDQIWHRRLARPHRRRFYFDNVRRVAGGIASYVLRQENPAHGVFIGYDTRFHSRPPRWRLRPSLRREFRYGLQKILFRRRRYSGGKSPGWRRWCDGHFES